MDELTITALIAVVFALVCVAAALWVILGTPATSDPQAEPVPVARDAMTPDAWRVVHAANRSRHPMIRKVTR